MTTKDKLGTILGRCYLCNKLIITLRDLKWGVRFKHNNQDYRCCRICTHHQMQRAIQGEDVFKPI